MFMQILYVQSSQENLNADWILDTVKKVLLIL